MYKILIVDDERNERMGLMKLIHRYNYPLEVIQAKNGEEALEIFSKENIDILLTDIKMPFMNGIELIEAIHKQGGSPICIIYSAYGEFEYAQNAIALGVLQYLLKPINLKDFENLFTKVFHLCEERERQREDSKQLLENKKHQENEYLYKNLMVYLEGASLDQEEELKIEEVFGKEGYLPIILSSYSFLFSLEWKKYVDDIRGLIGENAIIINKDDIQTLLLIPMKKELPVKKIEKLCEDIIEISKDNFQTDVFIVTGEISISLAKLRKTYKILKEALDYQFFISESTYLLCDKDYHLKKQSDMLPIYFSKIVTLAKLENYEGVRDEFDKVFVYIEKNVGFSSIYIKYNFTDILKKLCEAFHMEERMMEIAEGIYEARTLDQIKDQVIRILDDVTQVNKDKIRNENRLVGMIKNIVHDKYNDCTLSISSMADELNVSAAYLSTMFKVETGQNLIKFISNYRIERAKDLLRATNMKISDVGALVGYPNASYFINLFRNNVGLSPVQYRESRE